MKRQVAVPIWGKQPIPPGRLTEALAGVTDVDCCLLESTKTASAFSEGYRVFRCASRREAKEAIEKERRGEPHTRRLSLAVKDVP